MLKKYKYFVYGYEFEDFDLYDIFKNEPNIRFKNKNHEFILEKLKYFIGKYVSFVTPLKNGRRIINGIVEDVAYDNDFGNKIIYFKVRGEYNSVIEDDFKVTVCFTKSEINKYNL